MIVVDTNIIAYLFIFGEKTTLAQATRRREKNWIVPSIWQHEFLNVIATYIRHGNMPNEIGVKLLEQATAMLGHRTIDVNLPAALALATANNISAYDAQFVTLALMQERFLITEDKRLSVAFPKTAISMQTFLENHVDEGHGRFLD